MAGSSINTEGFAVKREDFDIERIADYLLLVKYHEQGLSLSVVDPASRICHVLEHHVYDTALNETALIVRLQNIWSKHIFLNAQFWKQVLVLKVGPPFSFVPAPFFSEDAAEQYLKLNAKVDAEQTEIYTEKLHDFEQYCICGIYQSVASWFKETYPPERVLFGHAHAAFVNAVSRLLATDDSQQLQGNLFLQINGHQAALLLLQYNELKFLNSFQFSTSNDLLYYTLLVLIENEIVPEESSIMYWGSPPPSFIQKASARLRKVEAGAKPQFITFSYEFDELLSVDYDIFGAVPAY